MITENCDRHDRRSAQPQAWYESFRANMTQALAEQTADEVVPRTVDDYLRRLRGALQGAPLALIQDALGDAEEYLREEIAAEAYRPESEVVARVARSFGLPHEVAEEYRMAERRLQSRLNPRPSSPPRFFSVLLDRRAFGAALYALLSLPLGTLYFVWVIISAILCLILAATFIGLPLVKPLIASVRWMALFEGRVIEILLGRRMPRRLPIEMPTRTGGSGAVPMLRDPRTWSSVFYMAAQLPLSIAYFSIAVTGLTLGLALTIAPLAEQVSGSEIMHFDFDWLESLSHSMPGAALLTLVGVAATTLALHVLRLLLTFLHAPYAEATLVKP